MVPSDPNHNMVILAQSKQTDDNNNTSNAFCAMRGGNALFPNDLGEDLLLLLFSLTSQMAEWTTGNLTTSSVHLSPQPQLTLGSPCPCCHFLHISVPVAVTLITA